MSLLWLLQVMGSLPLLPGGGGNVVAHACVDFFLVMGSTHADRSSSCHLILAGDGSLTSGPSVAAFHDPLGGIHHLQHPKDHARYHLSDSGKSSLP
jgi:hypothetical protein